MADKPTQLIVAALTRAASEPDGLALFASKSEPGLFPAVAVARSAAQRCKDEGYLDVLRTETKGKSTREICTLTPKGMLYLVRETSPRQVLEDFVRALESRHEEVRHLIDAGRAMQRSLDAMRTAVEDLLPQFNNEFRNSDVGLRIHESADPAIRNPQSATHNGQNGCMTMPTATRTATRPDLSYALIARLTDWHLSAGASEDCPLPELYRRLAPAGPPPTIGEFHDCLRHLHEEHQIYLHPWTGPLYELPEPAFALLIGHEIAYYASVRI